MAEAPPEPNQTPPGKPEKPKLLPPAWAVLAAAVMLHLNFYFPVIIILTPPATHLGWALIGIGIAIVVWAKRHFDAHETTVKPYEDSAALVTTGPYELTRNPMYLSLTLALIGIAIVLGSITPFLVIPFFVWVIRRKFIRVEEAMLEDAFADDYRAYKGRVRRWF